MNGGGLRHNRWRPRLSHASGPLGARLRKSSPARTFREAAVRGSEKQQRRVGKRTGLAAHTLQEWHSGYKFFVATPTRRAREQKKQNGARPAGLHDQARECRGEGELRRLASSVEELGSMYVPTASGIRRSGRVVMAAWLAFNTYILPSLRVQILTSCLSARPYWSLHTNSRRQQPSQARPRAVHFVWCHQPRQAFQPILTRSRRMA